MCQRKIVFLLGAGASKGLGLPTSVELLARIREWARQEKIPHASQIVEGVIEAYSPYNEHFNFEDLLTVVNSLAHREANELWPLVASLNEPFEAILKTQPELFESLYEAMWGFIRSQLTVTYGDGQEWSYLRNLIGIAKETDTPSIFTLNYDLSLEAVMEAASIKYSTGFKSLKGDAFYSAELQWWPLWLLRGSDAVKFNNTPEGENADVHLIKLHGSLDWFRIEAPVRSTVEGYQIYPQGPIVRSNSIPSNKIEEVMIAGRVGKQKLEEPFITLLREFYDEVSKADVLVIIGYSFSDAHINRILLDTLMRVRIYDTIVVNGPRWPVGANGVDFILANFMSDEAEMTWSTLCHRYDMVSEYEADIHTLPYYAEKAINEGHLRRAIEKDWK